MVGRINVLYKGEVIGAGPGKMKHIERKAIWDLYSGGLPLVDVAGDMLIAEVAFMRDPSYKALREARFSRWRTDKNEPSEVE